MANKRELEKYVSELEQEQQDLRDAIDDVLGDDQLSDVQKLETIDDLIAEYGEEEGSDEEVEEGE